MNSPALNFVIGLMIIFLRNTTIRIINKIWKQLIRAKPVSYTHLMLMFNSFSKRAAAIQYLTEDEKLNSGHKWNCTSCVIPNGIDFSSLKQGIVHNYDNIDNVIKGIFIGRISIYHKGLDPVSYTHLDVYKRQVLPIPMLTSKVTSSVFTIFLKPAVTVMIMGRVGYSTLCMPLPVPFMAVTPKSRIAPMTKWIILSVFMPLPRRVTN